ncbi:hypothetical protein GQ42DRAFT_125826 [Ramicandelaber brevisporus]|nr:hypothetical protein GQ42DRAFT_128178 [Ramicandelaber brevisporus]KAI8868022.1 hypothetical protein GQ42DRAFT_125826 [Ramicandelaber brevisporus]
MSERRPRGIPIVLVLGIATSISTTIQQKFSRRTLQYLRMEKINLQQPLDTFDEIVQQVLIAAPFGLALGYSAYRTVLDEFLLHCHSITSCIARLQYFVMSYFYAQPHNKLKELVKQDVDICTQLRMLPSMRKLIDEALKDNSNDNSNNSDLKRRVLSILSNDSYLAKSVTPAFCGDLRLYQQHYSLALDLIMILQDLRKSVEASASQASWRPRRTIHLLNLGLADGRTDLTAFMRRIPSNCLAGLKARITHLLEQYPELVNDACETLLNIQLDKPASELKQQQQPQKPQASELNAIELSATPSVRRMTRQASAALAPTSSSRLAILQQAETHPFVQALITLLSSWTRCYKSLPLHELFYIDDDRLSRRAFDPDTHAVIQTALAKPQHYMMCDCCGTDGDGYEGGIEASQHDTGIVYQLYKECGKMINLYDWMMAFHVIVEPDKDEEGEKVLDVTRQIQARFIRSVSELQWLGFIRSTQRKTDHVAKQIW